MRCIFHKPLMDCKFVSFSKFYILLRSFCTHWNALKFILNMLFKKIKINLFISNISLFKVSKFWLERYLGMVIVFLTSENYFLQEVWNVLYLTLVLVANPETFLVRVDNAYISYKFFNIIYKEKYNNMK